MTDRAAPIPRPLGRLAEPFYAAAIRWRNRAFDSGKRVTRLDLPVISVGNLSVGGVGKTPTAMWAVDRLRSLGRTPAVAMRGYGPKTDGVSDEQAEFLDQFPNLPMAVGPRRVETIPALRRDRPDVDCVVLDDGFQHRFLHRDLDVVLIDATRSPFLDRLLPAGWLREPIGSLARAHAVVITHTEAASAEAVADLDAALRRGFEHLTIAHATHAWTGLAVHLPDGSRHDHPVDWLAGRPVVALAAIGNPSPFLDRLDASGARVLHVETRRDHASFQADHDEFLTRLAGRSGSAEAVVTTRKDWVKLHHRPEILTLPVAVPALALRIHHGEAELIDRLQGGL